MASSRKKSVVSTIDIPLPTQTNTLLNKSASSSSSLYQQCSQLRATLNRIDNFSVFLDRIADGQVPDPVNHLWDCFALGTPLCFLFNRLPPPASPINIDTDPTTIDLDPSNVKATKIAIIKFIMAVQKMQQEGNWENSELFQVTELTDRNMDGFVKVIATVTYLVDLLPKSAFAPVAPPSPPIPTHRPSVTGSIHTNDPDSPTPASASSKEADRRNIISELINTERKYVGDLEVMQKYATALLQRSVIDQDTILELFPGLNKLLDFQRRFLIRLEQVGEMPWVEQHWGRCFSECEAEFEVYAPYCANYDNAVEVLLREEQHLMELSTLIHPKSDLPAFLIKPVQRICKYPLLLDSLIKACSADDYPYYAELVEGAASTKRVTLRINEAQRKAENRQIMKALEARIEDWKGHHIVNFGDLLLQDFFSVTKSEVDRDYHVFLFEKIILCCKEDPRAMMGGNKKVSKSNSILKKTASGVQQTPFPGNMASSARKGTTPLLLKGRIFLNNVIEATPTGVHDLRVSWKGDDDTEHFTLRCRNEEQLKLWETQINRLISASNQRRKLSTTQGSGMANSTNPAALRMQSVSYEKTASQSAFSIHSSKYGRASTPVFQGDDRWRHQSEMGGFDMEDEMDDVLPPSVYPISGRGTPLGTRRVGSAQSMPPERDIPPGYDRPRARTEDHGGQIMQQWRMNGHGIPPPPPPAGMSYTSNTRPGTSRMASSTSVASEASFGTTVPRSSLRSQASSTRLRPNYDSADSGEPIARVSSALSGMSLPPNVSAPYPSTRSRSASLAGSHVPSHSGQPTPPVPSPYNRSAQPTPVNDRVKRDSGSSNTTQDSSDFSPPASNSPVSPYTSVDSAPGTLRHTRSQMLSSNGGGSMRAYSPPIKVKVHYGDDLFVIMVNRSIEYGDLVEKVGKKIRLCGGRRDGSPLRVKYQDEDGDMVSLGSNEDVQMAFDITRPGGGGQVTLFVS